MSAARVQKQTAALQTRPRRITEIVGDAENGTRKTGRSRRSLSVREVSESDEPTVGADWMGEQIRRATFTGRAAFGLLLFPTDVRSCARYRTDGIIIIIICIRAKNKLHGRDRY